MYLLGLSYGVVSLALEALCTYLSKTAIYEVVQAAALYLYGPVLVRAGQGYRTGAERVPGMKRQHVFAGLRTPAMGSDVTGSRLPAILDWLLKSTEHQTPFSVLNAFRASAIQTPTVSLPLYLPRQFRLHLGQGCHVALQVALAVASGGRVLGRRAQQGPVLYLALEDSPRRLKQRMVRQGWTPGLPADFMPLGQFTSQIGDLRGGGGERLAAQIERLGYRLVVIDTLSRACPGAQSDAEQMTRALVLLQEMAHLKNCVVFMSDHHRKTSGADLDAVSDILGSTAKGAMADSIWGLYTDGGKKGARLVVVGRDIQERTLALSMDWLTGCWQFEGDADALELTERRQEILDALQILGRADGLPYLYCEAQFVLSLYVHDQNCTRHLLRLRRHSNTRCIEGGCGAAPPGKVISSSLSSPVC